MNGTDGWSAIWDTTSFAPGIYNLRVSAYDTTGQVARSKATVSVGTNPQGDWVGTYGSAGYVLAAWNGTAANSDLVNLPAGASAALEVGSRAVVVHHRRARPRYARREPAPAGHLPRHLAAGAAQLRQQLQRALHLYAVDWDNLNRRETVSVASGGNTQTIALTTNFSQVPGCTSQSLSRPVAR